MEHNSTTVYIYRNELQIQEKLNYCAITKHAEICHNNSQGVNCRCIINVNPWEMLLKPEKANMTVEALSVQVGITERYLYRIENEGQKPRYDVLYKLIRTLSIPADTIFYPEMEDVKTEAEDLLRALCACDERFLGVAKATIQALIDVSDNE